MCLIISMNISCMKHLNNKDVKLLFSMDEIISYKFRDMLIKKLKYEEEKYV